MNSALQSLLKVQTDLLKAGLSTLGSGVNAVQARLEGIAGQGHDSPNSAPVDGPQNLDSALADFANHMVRILRITRPEPGEILKTAGEAFDSARRSFGYVGLSDPRTLALSLALPLSVSKMMAEAMLRGLMFLQALGPEHFTGSTFDFMETQSDIGPFVGLQYKNLIERHEARLGQAPDDAVTRRELGRVYIKCGRYAEAVIELTKAAAEDPSIRGLALYDSCVASYRGGKFADAVRYGVNAMTENPHNERARYWIWMASRKLDGYPASVPTAFQMELRAGIAPTTLEYENIAAKVGLNKTSAGRGTAIFDYNNDGLLDVAITSAHGGTNLYRNNGDGTFTDVSIGSGIDQAVNGFGISAGDYDNDGFTDLYITRLGWYPGPGTLYHNNGDGTFTDVTEKAGLANWGPCFSASWVDYDCDGNLDLFIPHNVGGIFDRHVPHRLFHNNGDGTFTDVTEKAGITSVLPAIGSAWGDYNNDGYPDLFFSGLGHAQLFRNNGDGTFTDVTKEAGFDDPALGSVCTFVDYDNDGWLDILQFVWSEYEDVIHTMGAGRGPDSGKSARIWHNNRDGTFTRKDTEIGLNGCWGTMSGAYGDLDNNGHLDFMLGNGAPPMDRIEPMILLQNDGTGFRNTTFAAGLPFTGKSHGVNCADFFGDGRLSILVSAGGLYPGDLLTSTVFCPRERGGNYLNVRVKGTKCNRDAIGARVTMFTQDGQQMREVSGGTNFGCLPTEQHFGLGKLKKIAAVEIRWPGGATQRADNPPVNATIQIVEGEAGFEQIHFAKLPEGN